MMIFLDERCTFNLIFSSNKYVESFINILKFLCHEHNFLGHGPQLLAHSSFNKVPLLSRAEISLLLIFKKYAYILLMVGLHVMIRD